MRVKKKVQNESTPSQRQKALEKDVNAFLKAGNKIPGPAVVTEFDSTTVILADCVGEVDKVGCILITPKGWKGGKKKSASKSKGKK